MDFQLNVFNLLSDDEVMPTALNANGHSYAQYQYRDPRSFRFTVRLDF